MFDILTNYFVDPLYLVGFILVVLLMIVLIGSSKGLYLTRTLILIILVLALSEPYSPDTLFGGGNSKLTILEDESDSYSVFEEGKGEEAYSLLNKQVSANYEKFGKDINSNIGDSLISEINKGNNVLILSDGYINQGSDYEEIRKALLSKNVSLNLLESEISEEDYLVKIIGPDKIPPDTEATFTIQVTGTESYDSTVSLFVDGNEVLTESGSIIEYKQKFSEGTHKLTARISKGGYFEENDVYYKSLKVVEKPKVLLFGEQGSPLYKTLNKLYNVEVGSLFNLDRFHTVVIDNKDLDEFSDKIDELKDFVNKGNGLIVVGGEESFEEGDYKGSDFEDLLPVKVSGSGKKEGGINVILLLDVSGSTGDNEAEVQAQDLAVKIVEQIDKKHNLGVIKFAKNIEDVLPLAPLEDQDINEVKSWIVSGKPTKDFSLDLSSALFEAEKMLSDYVGGKNVILIGDGDAGNLDLSYKEVEGCEECPFIINDPVLNKLDKKGIKIYSVGVGENTNVNDYETLSLLTEGEFYNSVFSVEKLSFVFGDPLKASGKKSKINIEKDNHFITEGLFLTANVDGVNQVLPKGSAQLLISSGKGEPVLSVWRQGLGRIAVFSTDNGDYWSGDLYVGANSKLISRTINWAVGDPERKEKYFFTINDARVGKENEILVKSETSPDVKGIDFERQKDGTFFATVEHDESGFYSFEEDEYSVNYNEEYEFIGTNPELKNLVLESGGTNFGEFDNIYDIIENLKNSGNVLSANKEIFVWPLIALAMVIFILDVWFRTISQRKNI